MKKFFLLSLTFVFTASTCFAASFSDVPSDHENYDAIEYLKANEVINGYEDGTFKPDDLVTRAQAAKIIIESLDIDYSGEYGEDFDDVPTDEWYFSYVMTGKENGFINGYGDGTFKPDQTVTLSEALKMMVVAAGISIPDRDDISSDVFADVDHNEWYAPHCLYARNNAILVADDRGQVHPEKELTRASFSEVMYRVLYVHENDKNFPISNNWPVYKSSTLPFSVSYNDSWEVLESDYEVVFFNPNEEYFQFSPERILNNSAKVVFTLDENDSGMNSTQYFNNIRSVFNDGNHTEFNIDGYEALEVLYSSDHIVDWYVYLNDGRVLAVYTEYGDGVMSYSFPQIISAMLPSLKYREISEVDYDVILSEILENILKENIGMQMLDKLPDTLIIETDTIGVGTGPVDYYYSEEVDYTFKYERAADLILDTREGQTSAF